MHLKHWSTFILTLWTLSSTVTPQDNGTRSSIVCFYNNEAATRTLTAKLHVKDVDVTSCTHLVYMSAAIERTQDGTVEIVGTIPQVDIQQGGFAGVTAFSRQIPKLKVFVMISVTDYLTNFLQEESSNDVYIPKFKEFLENQRFDGYCFNFNVGHFDFQNLQYLSIFSTLEESLKTTNFSFAAIIPAIVPAKNASFIHQDWIKFMNRLEFVGVATFDMHRFSASHNYVDSHSPLNGTLTGNCTNVVCAVDAWLARGLAAEKLLIGIATHGVSFTLANPKNNRLLAAALDAGTPGAYLRKKGVRAHYEICSSLSSDSWTKHLDEIGLVPFAVSGRQWVGYEDAKSIGKKVKYVQKRGLAGIFVWTLDTDDFMGMCGQPWVLTSAAFRSQDEQQSNVTTDVDPVPYNCTSEGLFSDPQDCHKFIQCSRGLKDYRMDCPDGLHFNSKELYCDWPHLANCTIELDADDAVETTNVENFTCLDKSGLFQDPRNCSCFYWCSYGLLVGHSTCPPGLLFNDDLKVCDWRKNVNCTL